VTVGTRCRVAGRGLVELLVEFLEVLRPVAVGLVARVPRLELHFIHLGHR
jgi:hypothetical protein